jgi:L-threonylcarbamoyladenylate synthase
VTAEPRRLHVDPRVPDPEIIRQAAAAVLEGGVIGFPTDTLYGLAADPRSPASVRKIFAIKGRPQDRPIPLVASGIEAVELAARLTPVGRRLAAGFWPGPLTLILPADPGIAADVHRGSGRIGIRVPGHTVARALAAAAGGAITATSANRSGEPAAAHAEAMRHLAGLDLVLDAGPLAGGAPSTIVDASGDTPVLVRAGAVPWERVLEFLG